MFDLVAAFYVSYGVARRAQPHAVLLTQLLLDSCVNYVHP